MGIFSPAKSYLGVDLGSSGVKVVELANDKGRPRLWTYGFSKKSINLADNLGKPKAKVASFLKRICQKARTSSSKAITALPTFSIFSSVIYLPQMKKKELTEAIQWEAKKVVPLPLTEMILDWKILPLAEAEKSKSSRSQTLESPEANTSLQPLATGDFRILLTAAPRNLVKRQVDIFTAAGLTILSLETEVFALIRSLIGNDKSVIMLVDSGEQTTNISVVDQGVPYLNRSIEVGAKTVTQTISLGLSVSDQEAEQFKHDLSFHDLNLKEEKIDASWADVLQATVAPIVNEIKYSFNLFENQTERKIEKIILAGGGSLLVGFKDSIAKLLEVPVYLGDPWARVVYPEELRPQLEEIGPSMAVAVGLAMREIS